ncbi:MAG: hemolysin III family protein [Actinomycetia bacterium]|nr:hemolysin III family protein [Actinomycetes bacterium]MCP4961447.1 hemolysin III family protein [Actinomycetes bacterium]
MPAIAADPQTVNAEQGDTRPIGRGWSHVFAAVAAIVLCPIVIVHSAGQRVEIALFAAGVIGLFTVSATYHRLAWGTRAHELFRRLDHSMIYFTIAATHTPVLIVVLDGAALVMMLVIAWTGAAVGAIVQSTWATPPRWLTVGSYAAVGWCVAPVVTRLWGLGVAAFVLLVAGGIIHSVGALVYGIRRPDPFPRWFGFHEVFHALVVAAVAVHYVAIGVLI